MEKIFRHQFLKEAKKRWPNIAPLINAEEGQLHFEMKHVRNVVQRLIDSGAASELQDALVFLEQCYIQGDEALRNAIDVSLVEELEFEDRGKLNREWAFRLLPPGLKELYEAFHGYK